MPERFHVDPSSLRTAGRESAAIATTLASSLDRLSAALLRLGEPWGSDEPGRAFGSQHEPASAGLVDHVGALVAGLGSVGDGLEVMAQRYEDSDGASTIPGSPR